MQGCGLVDVEDELIGELVGIDALTTHLVHDDTRVGSRVANMVAGELVTAFDEVCHDHDEIALHAVDGVALFIGLLDVLHGIVRELVDGRVEVLYLIAGMDIQGGHGIRALGAFALVSKRKNRLIDPTHTHG